VRTWRCVDLRLPGALLAAAAIGMLIGLAWFFFTGVAPALLLAVAAWLANRSAPSHPKAPA